MAARSGCAFIGKENFGRWGGTSMTRESNLWSLFRELLPPAWHVVRIENSVELGTPDVNLCVASTIGEYGIHGRDAKEYWIELKVQEPPKRATTTFGCEHFTMEQRQWLVDRCRAGGRAYLLLQAGGLYLFIRGDVAAVWIGHCTLATLRAKSEWVGDSLKDLVIHLEG